jgi:hypothetical protein
MIESRAHNSIIIVIQHSLMKLIAPMGGENFALYINGLERELGNFNQVTDKLKLGPAKLNLFRRSSIYEWRVANETGAKFSLMQIY